MDSKTGAISTITTALTMLQRTMDISPGGALAIKADDGKLLFDEMVTGTAEQVVNHMAMNKDNRGYDFVTFTGLSKETLNGICLSNNKHSLIFLQKPDGKQSDQETRKLWIQLIQTHKLCDVVWSTGYWITDESGDHEQHGTLKLNATFVDGVPVDSLATRTNNCGYTSKMLDYHLHPLDAIHREYCAGRTPSCPVRVWLLEFPCFANRVDFPPMVTITGEAKCPSPLLTGVVDNRLGKCEYKDGKRVRKWTRGPVVIDYAYSTGKKTTTTALECGNDHDDDEYEDIDTYLHEQ